jgi:hypothetical protein
MHESRAQPCAPSNPLSSASHDQAPPVPPFYTLETAAHHTSASALRLFSIMHAEEAVARCAGRGRFVRAGAARGAPAHTRPLLVG